MRLAHASQPLLMICLVLSLIGGSLMVVLLPQFTAFWSSRLSDIESSAVSPDELHQTAVDGLRYVAGGQDNMPRGDDPRTAFPEDVISHMRDVRSVFTVARIITLVASVAAACLSAALLRHRQKTRLGNLLSLSGIITLALVSVMVIFGWVNFDALFTSMHEILFADGTWTFSHDSLLITAYPFDFWVAMAATWAAILIFLCLAMIVLGRLIGKGGETI